MKVYKYRGVSFLERDLESIAKNYFWAPTADQLNDPSEAYVNENVRSSFQDFGASDVETEFKKLMNMRHTVGVYSLSQTPLDELMWAYYSESHKGFCIENDLDRLIHEARVSWNVVEVSYHSKPQTIISDDLFAAKDETIILEKMIGSKSRRWQHEEEIRIVTTEAGPNYYASSALTGIYFGCRCEESTILKARKELQGRNLKYYQIEFADDAYSMKPREIEYDEDIDGVRTEYLAPIEEHAIPNIEHIKETNRPYYECLAKAVDIFRRDSSCERITGAGFSTTRQSNGKPTVYVQYKTNVQTQYSNELNRHFDIDELLSTVRDTSD
ncbi:MAG: DUF2971 domain-containing protein [Deltaproteobacteria bacterium]|nr:DUF2971 domain-containing protein [Deltaproteobacteria bacterium]